MLPGAIVLSKPTEAKQPQKNEPEVPFKNAFSKQQKWRSDKTVKTGKTKRGLKQKVDSKENWSKGILLWFY